MVGVFRGEEPRGERGVSEGTRRSDRDEGGSS